MIMCENTRVSSEFKSDGEVVVILPARGGSKRFPRKNIASLLGRPLIAYPIAAAKLADKVDAVYVSTEDEEIAELSRRAGADVPFLRPENLAGDLVTADAAVADMVQKLQETSGRSISIVVLIQPTSPFVTSAHINAAVALLQSDAQLDSVTTMAEVDHRHHPYNLAFPSDGSRWEFIHSDERKNARNRQSKPKAYKFGNLFAARTETLLKDGRFGPVKGMVEIDPLYSWDIDHAWELGVAEIMIENKVVSLPQMESM